MLKPGVAAEIVLGSGVSRRPMDKIPRKWSDAEIRNGGTDSPFVPGRLRSTDVAGAVRDGWQSRDQFCRERAPKGGRLLWDKELQDFVVENSDDEEAHDEWAERYGHSWTAEEAWNGPSGDRYLDDPLV